MSMNTALLPFGLWVVDVFPLLYRIMLDIAVFPLLFALSHALSVAACVAFLELLSSMLFLLLLLLQFLWRFVSEFSMGVGLFLFESQWL